MSALSIKKFYILTRSFLREATATRTICHSSQLYSNICNSEISKNKKGSVQDNFKNKLLNGPSLDYFIQNSTTQPLLPSSEYFDRGSVVHPYIASEEISGRGRKVFIETYGCQMNVNDTEIVRSILKKSGFENAQTISDADVILIMTCAIREGAEEKIWNRLIFLRSLKRKRGIKKNSPSVIVGVLGCMAERLKTKLIEKEKVVDVVAGPDSYRDLPRLLADANQGNAAVNVLLSLEETYADIVPIRINEKSRSAFVSIMRGCNNMCSYCIVPFTRGRERSRPIASILDEVKILSDQGIKEITLLGQNVNSYLDTSEESHAFIKRSSNSPALSKGFNSILKLKPGGLGFADLLEKVSLVNPEIRIRFTSPHPKDFPDEVLDVIKNQSNVCNCIHLPAQSGNTQILENMRRGYSREAYLDLVSHIRNIIPNISLTSDFICGFCGESEEAHLDTLSLVEQVKYEFAFVFPYSMRERTRAHYRLQDDVPIDVKKKRTSDVLAAFRKDALKLHQQLVGSQQLVLTEGVSRRSEEYLAGRNDGNTKVIFPKQLIPDFSDSTLTKSIDAGDYVVVQIVDCSSQVLKGIPLYHTTLQEFARKTNSSQKNLEQKCVA